MLRNLLILTKSIFPTRFYFLKMCSNVGRRQRVSPNFPTRFHPSEVIDFGSEKVGNDS